MDSIANEFVLWLFCGHAMRLPGAAVDGAHSIFPICTNTSRIQNKLPFPRNTHRAQLDTFSAMRPRRLSEGKVRRKTNSFNQNNINLNDDNT